MKTLKKFLTWYFLFNTVFFMYVAMFMHEIPIELSSLLAGISFFGYIMAVSDEWKTFKETILD